ncbi:hypothetical protein Pcac1_g27023 [Phytophthora cactorum]|nr:hypothetical protein Pcac1_g27027 [Phytophthora cactorum]KAG2761095.1 hypothetical protein Pcac1_g27023 [Phytophthora cactorum]
MGTPRGANFQFVKNILYSGAPAVHFNMTIVKMHIVAAIA